MLIRRAKDPTEPQKRGRLFTHESYNPSNNRRRPLNRKPESTKTTNPHRTNTAASSNQRGKSRGGRENHKAKQTEFPDHTDLPSHPYRQEAGIPSPLGRTIPTTPARPSSEETSPSKPLNTNHRRLPGRPKPHYPPGRQSTPISYASFPHAKTARPSPPNSKPTPQHRHKEKPTADLQRRKAKTTCRSPPGASLEGPKKPQS